MTDFEEDDIDWEDEEIVLADEEDLEIELGKEGSSDGGSGNDKPKKAKRNPVRYTPEERTQARKRFTNHLNRESNQAVSMSQRCNESETKALLHISHA